MEHPLMIFFLCDARHIESFICPATKIVDRPIMFSLSGFSGRDNPSHGSRARLDGRADASGGRYSPASAHRAARRRGCLLLLATSGIRDGGA